MVELICVATNWHCSVYIMLMYHAWLYYLIVTVIIIVFSVLYYSIAIGRNVMRIL